MAMSCVVNGTRLVEDASYYASLGTHQVGYPGHSAAEAWLLSRLRRLSVHAWREEFELPGPQFLNESCSLSMTDGSTHQCRALWPPPPTGRIVQQQGPPFRIVKYAGSVVDQTADLVSRVNMAIELGARAVLVVLQGRQEPRQLNLQYSSNTARWPVRARPHILTLSCCPAVLLPANATGEPRPPCHPPAQVPVALVGEALLNVRSEEVASLEMAGGYGEVSAANIFGEVLFGAASTPASTPAPASPSRVPAQTVVVSTPFSSWGPAGGERGPGLALLLALAEALSAQALSAHGGASPDVQPPRRLLLIATDAHELGHLGMRRALATLGARGVTPSSVALWLHLGSSIATAERAAAGRRLPRGARGRVRLANALYSLPPTQAATAIPALRSAGLWARILPPSAARRSEITDVAAAGFACIGLAGTHDTFHSAMDTAASLPPAQTLSLLGCTLAKILTSALEPPASAPGTHVLAPLGRSGGSQRRIPTPDPHGLAPLDPDGILYFPRVPKTGSTLLLALLRACAGRSAAEGEESFGDSVATDPLGLACSARHAGRERGRQGYTFYGRQICAATAVSGLRYRSAARKGGGGGTAACRLGAPMELVCAHLKGLRKPGALALHAPYKPCPPSTG